MRGSAFRIMGLFTVLLIQIQIKAQACCSDEKNVQTFTIQTNLPQHQIETQLNGKLIGYVEPSLGIYRIRLNDLKTLASEQFINLSDKQYFVFAQQLHSKVSLRVSTPNDPGYSQQYCYNYTQTNKVWDYNKGGLNRRGDTLVIGYVDNGFDTTHPDLFPNLRINYKEIQWNGIDEDSNGYTDDYFGWNGGDSNGVVVDYLNGPAHGTHVAGVMGARGNNGVGVTGVNWNIKILPCVFWSRKFDETENGIYRSLAYLLKMRKLFNQSQGKKGADIISVNLSFGFEGNNPRPADYPIFCNLIDSLYQNGILVSCATTNNGTNVSITGDIPTLCPSNGLISATTTNEFDVFPTTGYNGYSPTDVDLAAPGFNIYSTNSVSGQTGGGYTSRSGTSFASPQVASTAALIHSHVCEYYLQLMDTLPDSAVRLMKQWILEGTDKLPSLSGKTLTGGRLNAWNAFLKMDAWCMQRDTVYRNAKTYNPAKTQISFYPNPASAGQSIMLQSRNATNTRLLLYSINGKLIYTAETGNNGVFTLPANLSAGTYIVQTAIGRSKLIVY